MRHINKFKLVALLATFVFVSGCSTHPAHNSPELIPARIDKDLRELEDVRRTNRNPEKATATRSNRVIRIPRGHEWLREVIQLDFTAPFHQALNEILDGRPITYKLLDNTNLENVANSAVPGSIPLVNGQQFSRTGSPRDSEQSIRRSVVSSPAEAKSIKQHLDAITTQAGVNYEVVDDTIVISDFEVKTFNVASSIAVTKSEFLFSGNEDLVSDGASAQNDDNRAGIFGSLIVGLSPLLRSPSSVFTSPVFNSIIVAARPSEMRQAEKYINDFNRRISQRVLIKVEVYDVDLSALGARSLDFSLANVISESSLLTGVTATITQDTTNVINTEAAPNVFRFGVDRPGRSIDGAEGLIRYLRQQGSLTTRVSSEFVVANNDTQSDVRTTVTPFVSGVTIQNNNATGGLGIGNNLPTIQTDEANTGTALQVRPTIAGDKIFINLSVEESRLIALTPFSFGDEDTGTVSGELPTTTNIRSTHNVSLNNGETIVIGARQFTQRALQNRSGSVLLPVLGDSVDKNETRIQTMIVVTGRIIG